jgi:hypothetical protein
MAQFWNLSTISVILIFRKIYFYADYKNFSISSIAFSQYLLHFCSFLTFKLAHAIFAYKIILMNSSSSNASLLTRFLPICMTKDLHPWVRWLFSRTWCWCRSSGSIVAGRPSWIGTRNTGGRWLLLWVKVLDFFSKMIGLMSARSVNLNSYYATYCMGLVYS